MKILILLFLVYKFRKFIFFHKSPWEVNHEKLFNKLTDNILKINRKNKNIRKDRELIYVINHKKRRGKKKKRYNKNKNKFKRKLLLSKFLFGDKEEEKREYFKNKNRNFNEQFYFLNRIYQQSRSINRKSGYLFYSVKNKMFKLMNNLNIYLT